jgi:hypothetical protein
MISNKPSLKGMMLREEIYCSNCNQLIATRNIGTYTFNDAIKLMRDFSDGLKDEIRKHNDGACLI